MFRIEVFLNEMLEKVEKAELLLSKESVNTIKPKEEKEHTI